MEVPLAAVQQLPAGQQAAALAAIFAALGLGTALLVSFHVPPVGTPGALFLGATFVAAGVAHFTAHDAYCTMMPPQGAWGGIWRLPGSASFHVTWSGLAEIGGGVGLLLGSVPAVADDVAPWLRPAAALGLFALTVAVTPSNVLM